METVLTFEAQFDARYMNFVLFKSLLLSRMIFCHKFNVVHPLAKNQEQLQLGNDFKNSSHCENVLYNNHFSSIFFYSFNPYGKQ